MIPDTIKVDAAGKVNLSIPSNNGQDHGYLIYGVAAPQGSMTLANRGTAQVLAGATPTIANNGTARLANISVVTSNSFTVQLNTTPVSLADPDHAGQFVRDVHADGDTAMIKVDGGMNINGVAGIDNTTPGDVGYGFENFTTTRTPGFIWNGSTNVGTGSGLYVQSIDTTQLSEGSTTSRCGRFGIAMRRLAATAALRCSPISSKRFTSIGCRRFRRSTALTRSHPIRTIRTIAIWS